MSPHPRYERSIREMRKAPESPDMPLPAEVVEQLAARGIAARDEVALRRDLERHAPSYTLLRLNRVAARKWKARYRIMLAADYFDCQSVAEAYARALLASLPSSLSVEEATPTEPNEPTEP